MKTQSVQEMKEHLKIVNQYIGDATLIDPIMACEGGVPVIFRSAERSR